MAVEYTGTLASWTGTSDGSFSVTVPVDADICIVTMSGYNAQANLIDALNFDNGGTLYFTLIEESLFSDAAYVVSSAYYMTDQDANWPGSGSKTLYVEIVGPLHEGITIACFFFSGVDTTSPIIGTDENGGADGDASWTSSIADVAAGDMGVLSIYSYSPYAYPNTPTLNGNSQTQIYNGAYNSAVLAIAYKSGEGALEFSEADYGLAVAFVVKAASLSLLPILKKRFKPLIRM